MAMSRVDFCIAEVLHMDYEHRELSSIYSPQSLLIGLKWDINVGSQSAFAAKDEQ